MKNNFKLYWQKVSNLDRLSYALVSAFGLCLLGVSLFFHFGYMLGEKQIIPNPIVRNEITEPETTQKLLLLDEPSPIIRGIEVAISIGMIILGIERLKTYKKRKEAILSNFINDYQTRERKEIK